jgi:hypothetical protein
MSTPIFILTVKSDKSDYTEPQHMYFFDPKKRADKLTDLENLGYTITLSSLLTEDDYLEDSQDEIREVQTTVIALIPEYHQVKVRDDTGALYTLTRKTFGIELRDLYVGQRVLCTVTNKLPRVLSAEIVTNSHGGCAQG